MYEEFLENFCKSKGISTKNALELAIVKEIMREKERYEHEMSDLRGEIKH